MKKITANSVRKITLVIFGISLAATFAGLLLASGILRFNSDAYDDLLLSYVGIITSLISVTFVGISWFAYVLVSREIAKEKPKQSLKN